MGQSAEIPVWTWGVVVTAVLLNVGAQLLLKAGTGSLGTLVSDKGPVQTVFRVFFEPHIFIGMLTYVVSFGLWIVVLSRVPVSIAYPMLSLGYVVNAFMAYFLFQEALGAMKLTGIGIILIGVFVLARSA